MTAPTGPGTITAYLTADEVKFLQVYRFITGTAAAHSMDAAEMSRWRDDIKNTAGLLARDLTAAIAPGRYSRGRSLPPPFTLERDDVRSRFRIFPMEYVTRDAPSGGSGTVVVVAVDNGVIDLNAPVGEVNIRPAPGQPYPTDTRLRWEPASARQAGVFLAALDTVVARYAPYIQHPPDRSRWQDLGALAAQFRQRLDGARSVGS